MPKPVDHPRQPHLEKHLSIADACALTSFSRTTLKAALRHRELGFVKFGEGRGRVLIPESELARWLERRGTYFPRAERPSSP